MEFAHGAVGDHSSPLLSGIDGLGGEFGKNVDRLLPNWRLIERSQIVNFGTRVVLVVDGNDEVYQFFGANFLDERIPKFLGNLRKACAQRSDDLPQSICRYVRRSGEFDELADLSSLRGLILVR